mmetsp:Transcript_9118/g.16187  ORF Transcript_9118/g.16187 Transcript_9118/m.16187 type:complete len:149 (-) Transcript_9118:954-1400(-)
MAFKWLRLLCLLVLLASFRCEDHSKKSGSELKRLLRERGLRCEGCVDKADALALLRHRSAQVVSDLTSTASDGEHQLLSDYQVSEWQRQAIIALENSESPEPYPRLIDGAICEDRVNGTICRMLDLEHLLTVMEDEEEPLHVVVEASA